MQEVSLLPPAPARADLKPAATAADAPVSEIMTQSVISLGVDCILQEATRVVLEHGVSGAPVVDAAGRPVGMVSQSDLLEAWHEHAADQEGNLAVGDLMVPYLLAVSRDAPVSLAAALMAYEGVHRLLVLDESNQMVGIVSALDVLRWLARLSGFCLPGQTRQQRA